MGIFAFITNHFTRPVEEEDYARGFVEGRLKAYKEARARALISRGVDPDRAWGLAERMASEETFRKEVEERAALAAREYRAKWAAEQTDKHERKRGEDYVTLYLERGRPKSNREVTEKHGAEGQEEERARWEAWNRRRMRSDARGRCFREPLPPGCDRPRRPGLMPVGEEPARVSRGASRTLSRSAGRATSRRKSSRMRQGSNPPWTRPPPAT